jgi:hypothetical protein
MQSASVGACIENEAMRLMLDIYRYKDFVLRELYGYCIGEMTIVDIVSVYFAQRIGLGKSESAHSYQNGGKNRP